MMFMNSLVVLQEFSGSHQRCEGAQDVGDVNLVSIVDHFPGGSRSLLQTESYEKGEEFVIFNSYWPRLWIHTGW